MTAPGPPADMVDAWGRALRYLRVSVTDRCNLRCIYCMPASGEARAGAGRILPLEQTARLVGLCAGLGVEKVRLTGGEPLVRPDLASLINAAKKTPGIRTVALTTNGILLPEQLPALLAAGLDGVNLSLDTLDRGQYAALTRRDRLPQALAGLEAALAAPGLTVKLNCVPLADNEDQWVPLAALARDRGLVVRFIELMPIGLGGGLPRRSEAQVLSRLEAAFGPARPLEGPGDGPARYVAFPGFRGRVGFISAMTHPFCTACDRLRLTASGFLKTCLQYQNGADLGALLEAGADDEALRAAILEAVRRKPAGHHFGSPPGPGDEDRNMNEIGG